MLEGMVLDRATDSARGAFVVESLEPVATLDSNGNGASQAPGISNADPLAGTAASLERHNVSYFIIVRFSEMKSGE